MTTYWAPWVVSGPHSERDVLITVGEDGLIDRIEVGMQPTTDATRLEGTLMPGLVNTHSHAFHRALRGRTHGKGDHYAGKDFWRWRDGMYLVADRLDPDSYRRLATAVYAEMASTGITAVGEFHYIHHQPGGRPYADPNEMSHALVEAAMGAGVRLTILDTCYLSADMTGAPPAGAQLRFSDGSVESWAERHRALAERYRDSPHVVIGAAIHSVRAVPEAAMAVVAEACDGPLHVHVSEQRAENAAAIERFGRTPTRLLADAGALGSETTVIHGVHTDDADRSLLRSAGASVCVCPTTEADLGDGFAPVAEFAACNIPVALGSDAHAVVDLFTEMQSVERQDRARLGRRGVHQPSALLDMASVNGARSLGHGRWGLEPGAPADFVVVEPRSLRTAGTDNLIDLVLTATAADVRHVVVGGRQLVAQSEHLGLHDVPHLLEASIDEVWEMVS